MECIRSCSGFSCVGYLTELKMEVSKELFRSLGSNIAKIYEICGTFSFFFPPSQPEWKIIFMSLQLISYSSSRKALLPMQPSFTPALASASASPRCLPPASQVGGGTVTRHGILQCALSKLMSLPHEFPAQNKKITRHRL